MSKLLSTEIQHAIDLEVTKYPQGRQGSAVIFALRTVQEANGGHLTTELMDAVAQYLGLANIKVYEVATFYAMLKQEAQGKYRINVCNNISCMLRGSKEIVAHFKERLGIKVGETTHDGLFTLREIECLAHCDGAPMLQINDQHCHRHLTCEKVDELIDQLVQEAKVDDR